MDDLSTSSNNQLCIISSWWSEHEPRGSDERASKRRKMGLTRELHQPRSVPPHPRKGGSTGYSVDFRVSELAKAAAGEPVSVSTSSIRRWSTRAIPYRKTGNRASQQKLVGYDLWVRWLCTTTGTTQLILTLLPMRSDHLFLTALEGFSPDQRFLTS